MRVAGSRTALLVGVCAFAAYAAIVPALYGRPRPPVSAEMEVVIPRFAQVLMAAGDRFLAADMAAIRALVATTERMDVENYRILALVQQDVAWFNPAHEDNYYTAAAILPWVGEVDAAQRILKAASDARPFDWQPAFYYAFDEMHFRKRPQVGAQWLRIAADHARDEAEQIQLQQLAALWAARGEDLTFAINLHRAMAKQTKYKAFASFLEKRTQRFENLLAIEKAIERYRQRYDKLPARLDELVAQGVLTTLPVDPFGMHYTLDNAGKPQLAAQAPGKDSAPGAQRAGKTQ